LDNIYGYITTNVEDTGIALEKNEVISIEEFKTLLDKKDVQIVDVRGVAEFNTAHVKGAKNVFVGTLPANLDKFDKDKQIVIHCQSGDRATIATSLLAKNGFKNVKNYSGGMNEWVNKGNAVFSEN
jgi:hydroxyacylglutathione hydrolase